MTANFNLSANLCCWYS